jgi:hypothetical protein
VSEVTYKIILFFIACRNIFRFSVGWRNLYRILHKPSTPTSNQLSSLHIYSGRRRFRIPLLTQLPAECIQIFKSPQCLSLLLLWLSQCLLRLRKHWNLDAWVFSSFGSRTEDWRQMQRRIPLHRSNTHICTYAHILIFFRRFVLSLLLRTLHRKFIKNLFHHNKKASVCPKTIFLKLCVF